MNFMRRFLCAIEVSDHFSAWSIEQEYNFMRHFRSQMFFLSTQIYVTHYFTEDLPVLSRLNLDYKHKELPII